MVKSYSDKLRDPRWQKKRLKILERDKWTCQLCKDQETTLNVHHLEYGPEPWEIEDSKLTTLCWHCHTEIEHIKKGTEHELDFKSVRIYKSNDWNMNDRIMFTSLNGMVLMRIFDSSDHCLIGFEFYNDLANMKTLITHTLKHRKLGATGKK